MTKTSEGRRRVGGRAVILGSRWDAARHSTMPRTELLTQRVKSNHGEWPCPTVKREKVLS